MEDRHAGVGRLHRLDGEGAGHVAGFLRQPIGVRRVVEHEDAGLGGGERELQPLGADVGLVPGFGERGDVLGQAVEFVAARLQPPAAAVDDAQMPPAADRIAIAHLGLGHALAAGQAVTDGVVGGPIVGMLDLAQQLQRHGLVDLGVAQ